MKSKNKKPYIIVLIILFIFSLIVFLTVKNNNSKSNNLYLIIDQSSVFEYNKNKWQSISKLKYDQYNWKKCNYYEDSKFLGSNYLVYTNNKWYVFNSNKEAILQNNTFLAIGGNKKVQVKNITQVNTDQTDEILIRQVLNENSITDYQNYVTRSKVVTDLDNDNKNETLYILSNMFPTDFSPSKVYNIVFVKDDDAILYIYKDIDELANMYDNCKVYLNNIIDINQDSNYEIIIGCGYYSTNGVKNNMYTLNNKKYKLLISNK